MESTDLPAESHPLKSEEGIALPPDKGQHQQQHHHANCAEKEGASLRSPGQLSRWRTAAFFLSLFLCLTVVFAFSFIIPCPVRPISQRTWNRTYDNTTAYQFLAVADVDLDRVQDVLFAFRASNGGGGSSSLNSSCSDEGFAPPCAFLAALSGTNGRTLWQKPVAEDLLVVDCSIACDRSPGCLVVGKPDSVTALDLNTGQSLWKQSADFGANSTVLSPLLEVPDVDADGVSDFLVFTDMDKVEIKSWFFSGKSGTLIGSRGSLSLPGWIGHLMQVTETGAHYVLFCTASAVYGYSVKELYHTAVGLASHRSSLSLVEDPRWAAAIDSISHHLPLLSSGEIRYLKKMPGKSGTNILVVRSAMLELLDGQHLGSMWASSIPPHTFSEPVFGAYDSDAVDVVVESRVAPHKKKVLVVEGRSGAIDWETEVLWGAGSPQAATLNAADHRSVFLFWGRHQGDPNGTKPERIQQQQLYLFHPALPNVLLEMSSVPEPIVAFEAVLLERSRHACYLLLTGPRAGGVPGQVVISKRKLKEDLAGSRVVRLNQLAQDADQSIRERFLRMRYRSLG